MRDIDRTMNVVIEEITKDRTEVDAEKIKLAWRDYARYWPDCGRAMIALQETFMNSVECEKDLIEVGQFMSNLSWALQKKL